MKFSDITNAALGLLYPPVCAHCGEYLDFRSRQALCAACSDKFESELDSVCKDCFKFVRECECVPDRASKKIRKTFHAAEYDPLSESVTRSLVLTAKDHNYKYVGELMADVLSDTLSSHMTSFKGVVLTYVPRSPSKVKKTGVDQAKRTAELLSEKTGIPVVHALQRHGSREQKHLDSDERHENAYSSYTANLSAINLIEGKTVILYDDIMTTGATVSACSDILKTMGAKTVYCLTFGRAYRKKSTDDQIS